MIKLSLETCPCPAQWLEHELARKYNPNGLFLSVQQFLDCQESEGMIYRSTAEKTIATQEPDATQRTGTFDAPLSCMPAMMLTQWRNVQEFAASIPNPRL